jgi:hypothetical protein
MPTLDPRHMLPTLPLCERAKIDADRLWAEHHFNSPNLLSTPQYLTQTPKTSHHANTQLELIIKWYLAISHALTREAKRHTAVTFTSEFKRMKDVADRLFRRAQQWKGIVETLKAKEDGVEGKVLKRLPPRPQEQSRPRMPLRPQQPPRPQRPPMISKTRRALPNIASRRNEPNHGFSTSTVIIPFKAADTSVKGTVELETEAHAITMPAEHVEACGVESAEKMKRVDSVV